LGLHHVNQTADAIPGLFESWTVDPENPTRWIFTLRQGVTFHDGTPLTIDDIVGIYDAYGTTNRRNTTHQPRRSFERR